MDLEVRESPILDVQLNIDPITTRMVKGQGQVDRFAADLMFRRATVPAWQFQYVQYGTERLQQYDGVERGMRAAIRHADFKVTTLSDVLKRYSFSTLRDVDEIGNAHPLYRLRATAASFARDIVDLHMELQFATLVQTTTSYGTSHDIPIGAGDEWNDATPGSSFADVSAAAALITAKTGIRKGLLDVVISDSTYLAVESEVAFRDHLFAIGIRGVTESVIATYWGVNSVQVVNPIYVDDDGAVQPIYADELFMFYNGGGGRGVQTLDAMSSRGLVWGATANYRGGVANTPWLDRKTTSWWFPWTDYVKHVVINPNSAARITNTNADV